MFDKQKHAAGASFILSPVSWSVTSPTEAGVLLPTVGQAILPAAAFPGGSYARRYSLYGARAGRIAGCSQDWLPHPRLTAKVTDYSIQPQLEAQLSSDSWSVTSL